LKFGNRKWWNKEAEEAECSNLVQELLEALTCGCKLQEALTGVTGKKFVETDSGDTWRKRSFFYY